MTNASLLTKVAFALVVSLFAYWLLSAPRPHVHVRPRESVTYMSVATDTVPPCKCPPPHEGVIHPDIVGDFMKRCSAKPATTIVSQRAPTIDEQSLLLSPQYHFKPDQPESHKTKAAVIVESRAVDRLVRVILQFMKVLDDTWEVCIICYR
jgi:hypothetical protein